MKRTLPFIVLLVVLLCWTQSNQVRYWFHQRISDDLSNRTTQALRRGDIAQANALLVQYPDQWFMRIKDDSFFYKSFPQALSTLLGDSMIAITDTIKAKRFIAAVDKWPWPLRELAISRMTGHSQTLVGKRAWYTLGFKEVFRSRRYVIPENTAKERSCRRFEEWRQNLDYIAFSNQAVLAFAHSAGIGILLILAIVVQWMLVLRNPLIDQSYPGFKLTAADLWITIIVYVLWIISYICIGILLQWLIFNQDPLLPRTYTPQLSNWYYGVGAIISFTLSLFLIIMVQIRLGFRAMARRNQLETAVKPIVLWFTIIEQYKTILWRLWPVWLISLVYGIILARHYS